MQTIHCHSCGKVILEADIKDGAVRKKCKCGVWNIIEVRPAGQAKPYTERLGLSLK